ncbi:MAG TPA: hypothetical protein VH598_09485 [Verrucomicrobiae bacterium]|nr:hypothetical protein [Verrucomicrobiae bacterium]
MRKMFVLFAIALVLAGWGCGRDSLKAKDTSGSSWPDNLIARWHFTGDTQMAADKSAVTLKSIGAMPATDELLHRTIQKLATTPYRVLQHRMASTNDFSALFQPLLEDLPGAESFAELRGVAGQTPEFVLAVQLSNERAKIWKNNLSTVLTAWTGIPVTNIQVGEFKGWELKKHHPPNLFRFVQAGQWTVLALGQNELPNLAAVLDQIKKQGRPVAAAKDYWFSAWVDWPEVARRWPLAALPFKLPKAQLTLATREDYVRTKIEMAFPQPLALSLEPWRIPTNSIHDPLRSFTAVRGATPWLKQLKTVQELGAEPPSQFYVWAAAGIPFATFAAAPERDVTNYLQHLAPRLAPLANTNLHEHGFGEVKWNSTNSEMTLIGGVPMLSPYLRGMREAGGDFLFAGLFPPVPRKEGFPPELLTLLNSKTNSNLLYYDWEITEERLLQWRNLGVLYFLASRQMPGATNSPAQGWLTAISPKLGNCVTEITVTAPDKLTLIRKSPIGLTGLELTALGRWLDAPGFPLDATYPSFRSHPGGPPAKSPSPP